MYVNNINDQLDLVGHLYYSPTLMMHGQTEMKMKADVSVRYVLS